MQRFKDKFIDYSFIGTFSNIQSCCRLNDLNNLSNNRHFLIFDMIGLFSFRELTLKQSIDIMFEYLEVLDIKPDYVTIHPDKYEEWKIHYIDYDVEVRLDAECIWSDGSIGGYCTEFYKNDIEIGNIVNTLETCIDIGFGLERLLLCTGNLVYKTELEKLEESISILINNGVTISNNKQGYILKKLITKAIVFGSINEHRYFTDLKDNMKINYNKYLVSKEKPKFKDKDSKFWLDTFGIDINNVDFYTSLFIV